MPVYSNTPFQTPLLLQKGVPTYLFGSFSQQVANTQLALVTDAIDTGEATITAQLVSGRLPAVGDLISISGSANSSGDFNVSRVPVDSATFDAATNVMTVTFALSASDQLETADGGTVIIEPAEVPEALAAVASIACAIQAPESDSQFTVPVSVTFPTLPIAATVSLQGAIKNQDSEFTTLGTVSTVVGSTQITGPYSSAVLQRGYVYRLLVSGVVGTGTITGKVG